MAATPVPLTELNFDQRAAASHRGGPLLILAGAGTGKTATLVARLVGLLESGTVPERLLAVTFSRRSADELVRRVGAATDRAVARRITAGTFHAVAHAVLSDHADSLGLDRGFSVLDQGDAAELLGLVRPDGRTADGRTRRAPRPSTLLAIHSRVVNAGRPLAEIVREDFPWCESDLGDLRTTFRAYTERKREGGLLDFDDLLLAWRAALTAPASGPALAGCWDHVLVDEYQDTNPVQADILRVLGAEAGVTVVGDDAQAIYGFRAATVRNILDFPTLFPGSAQVRLERNYRSTQPLLDLANAVAAGLSEGPTKALWTDRVGGELPVVATCADEAAQADAVCESVLARRDEGLALHDQAVLFRSTHHSDLLELECRRRGIPFVKFGGLRFLEAAHVRDLLALLRVLDNPGDELAWHRVLLLAGGVGPAGARRLLDHLGVHPRRHGADPRVALRQGAPVPRRAVAALAGLADALDDCACGRLGPGAQVERLIAFLDPVVRARYDRPEARLADLVALARSAEAGGSLRRFLAEVTLDPPVSTGDLAGSPGLDDDHLVLSTVHSAKGGEWEAVHLIHAADGMFPSDLATGSTAGIDEERRLFYVALTRARRYLSVYVPLRYHHGSAHGRGDRHGYAQRTRFLPPALDHLVDHRAVRGPVPDRTSAGRPTGATDVPAALGAVLDGLW